MFGKNKEKASAPTSPQADVPAGNPMFFANPQVITLEQHANAKLRPNITMAFARSTNSVPLTAADIAEASNYYPIAFTQADPIIPVAIVGLEQTNYFIDKAGKWLEGCYVPAYVRKYPFVFMEMPDSDQLTLCIDESALTFDGAAEGVKLYDGKEPSAFTKSALEFCGAHQEQHKFTAAFCDMLKEKNMLVPQRSDVELASGRMIQLGGFQLIDLEKFNALSDADIVDWHKRGFLPLVYHIIQSHSNWRNLLELANKDQKGAGKNKK